MRIAAARPGRAIRPGCIVGQGIFDLTSMFVDPSLEGTPVDLSKWEIALDVDYSEDVNLQFVKAVQARQDNGYTWGEALRITREEFDES